jgi:predicted RNase H-like HicB family nuclease
MSGKERHMNIGDTTPIRYVFWQDYGVWLGHLEDYPDYMTQGATHEELQENLRDICADILGGLVPHIRQVGELRFA